MTMFTMATTVNFSNKIPTIPSPHLLDIPTGTVRLTVVTAGFLLHVLDIELQYLHAPTALERVLDFSVGAHCYLVSVIIFVTQPDYTQYLSR